MLEELKNHRQWVVRRSDKIPLNPHTGYQASVTNPLDWSDFYTAMACCTSDNDIGLGFVLTDNDPYAVIDFDDPHKQPKPLSQDEIIAIQVNQKAIYEAFPSYSEFSPSGTGIHTWLKGSVPSGKKRDCVEVYSSGRYMTVTFNAFNNVPITEQQHLLQLLWEDMGKASAPAAIYDSEAQTETDEEICRLAASGSNGNGDMFVELWYGRWQPFFPTQSEADLTFCNIVAFYTNNKEQVGRIYWNSHLFLDSPKRKRKAKHDYLFHESWGIVTKAFDRKGPVVDLSELIAKGQQRLEEERVKHETSQPTSVPVVNSDNPIHSVEQSEDEEIDAPPSTDWLQPPGLMGEIASFIYYNAVNPVKEVAVAAAIAYMAGIAGRGYNYSRTGLNQYVVLLADTSGGKEGAAQGMNKLTHAVRELVPAFERFIGPSDIASPQALVKQLVETPCMISHKDEFGMWLQKITGRYAKGNEIQLRGMLLALFGKSGHKETLRGSIYSDRQKNVPSVDSPSLTLFGDSTQQEFYKALDEDSISEGLVPRLTVIEASGERPTFNQWNNSNPPAPELVHKLASLGKRCLELELLKVPIHVRDTEEANAFHIAFREYCTDQVYADRKSPIAQIWSRAHLRMIRLAALVAVGINIDNPIVGIEEMQWAKSVILHGVHVIQHKFKQGEVGEISYSLEQRKAVGKIIRHYCKVSYYPKWEKAYGINKEMHSARVITNRYLQNNTNNLQCFRKERVPAQAFKTCINELVENGNLVKVDIASLKKAGKHGIAYYVTDLAGLKS